MNLRGRFSWSWLATFIFFCLHKKHALNEQSQRSIIYINVNLMRINAMKIYIVGDLTYLVADVDLPEVENLVILISQVAV